MSSIEIGIMAGAIFFTSALTTSTGVGGGSLLLALMLQFMTPAVAIPIHGAMQTFANGWRIWLLRENMMWPIILRFSILMPLVKISGSAVSRKHNAVRLCRDMFFPFEGCISAVTFHS